MAPKLNPGDRGQQSTPSEIDSLQRDDFELLSAFLDGEVTPLQRQQVMLRLESEPDLQRQYARLLKLHQGCQHLPVPEAAVNPPSKMVERVLAQLDRARYRRLTAWGGTAVAALFLAAVSGILPGKDSPAPQLAQSPAIQASPEPLMIAFNRPAIKIPKAAISKPSSFKPIEANFQLEGQK